MFVKTLTRKLFLAPDFRVRSRVSSQQWLGQFHRPLLGASLIVKTCAQFRVANSQVQYPILRPLYGDADELTGSNIHH